MKSLRKRSDVLRGWWILLVTFLALLLLGFNAFPENSSHESISEKQGFDGIAQRSVSAADSSPGDAERGQELFMGYVHFQNDGPPCMGCHNVGSNGLLGGGTMGPDLTNVSTKRSSEEIASILSNNGTTISPVMQPIFAVHPLTEDEQADLTAFLQASVGQPESNREMIVIGISLAGFAAAIILIEFVYRGRLRGVRRPLIKKAQVENR